MIQQDIFLCVQLSNMDNDKDPSDERKVFLLPYQDEAAVLQVPLTRKQKHFALQQLLVYNVIEKWRQELTDLASGMNDLCLLEYLKVHDSMATLSCLSVAS